MTKNKARKYIISPGMNIQINLEVKIRQSKIQSNYLSTMSGTFYQLCGRLGNSLMEDSMSFVQLFTDSLFWIL